MLNTEKEHLNNSGMASIRIAVLARARKRCESCGVLDGISAYNGSNWYTIRLQIAHLDYNDNNNDLSNLRALCPSCYAEYYDCDTSKIESPLQNPRNLSLDLSLSFED